MKINDNGIDRDMTVEEIAAYEADAEKSVIAQQAWEDKKKEKQAKILETLGITESEFRALFG